MSTAVTFYTPGTGRILSSGVTYEPQAVQPPDSGLVTGQIGHPEHDYVHKGQVIPRPPMPVSLAGARLNGVPKGATLLIDGLTYEADGSPIDLQFNYNGTYRVLITHWPYLDWSCELDH